MHFADVCIIAIFPIQLYNEFLVLHKQKMDSIPNLQKHMESAAKRFQSVTIPAIVELAKQQGESPENENNLGMTNL